MLTLRSVSKSLLRVPKYVTATYRSRSFKVFLKRGFLTWATHLGQTQIDFPPKTAMHFGIHLFSHVTFISSLINHICLQNAWTSKETPNEEVKVVKQCARDIYFQSWNFLSFSYRELNIVFFYVFADLTFKNHLHLSYE